jgi:hypothetical protein
MLLFMGFCGLSATPGTRFPVSYLFRIRAICPGMMQPNVPADLKLSALEEP